MNLYADRTFAIDTENAFKMGPHIARIEKDIHSQSGMDSVIKLNIGEPDFDIPIFVKEEIKRQLDNNNTHYCDPKGLLTLRSAIAKNIHDTRGLTVHPEQVVIFPGAKPAIGFSQQVYCNPGDEVIYPSPGFPIYESFTHYLGLKPVPLFLDEARDFVFTAQSLKKLITPKTKLIYLNFPSNPTGGVATKKELEQIAEVILSTADKNIRVFSDEIYENIIYDGHPYHSIANIPGMEKITIISSGFSKSFAWTGGRVGYAIFPTIDEANIFKNLNINYFSCVPPYNQEGARVALEHDDAKQVIESMVQTFDRRRKFIVEGLNAIPGVHCTMPKGAFYVFPNVEKACQQLGILDYFENLPPSQEKAQTSPTTLLQMFALYYHHVAFLDRRSFGKIGSQNQHFIRLSFATDIPLIEEGLNRLNNALSDNDGFLRFLKEKDKLVIL